MSTSLHTTPNVPTVVTLATSSLTSTKVYTKYGIHLSQAVFMNNNLWSLQPEIRDLFKQYYILSWTGEYFRDKMCNGTIERDGTIYQIIYYNTYPLEVKKAKEVFLSFRQLQTEFNYIPTVLVGLSKNGKRDYTL